MTERLYTPISNAILERIGKAEEIIVIGHANPDGDCIFSQLACREIFTRLGKKVTLLNQGPFSREDIKAFEGEFTDTVTDEMVASPALVVVVDCSTVDRPGEVIKPLLHHDIIVFDHHSSGEPFTREDYTYIKPLSVSTSLIIDHLRESLGVKLDHKMADYIYRGFATDTGFFHFINEKIGEETLLRVAALVGQGVSPYVVYDEMHDGKSLDYFKGVSRLVERTKSAFQGALLYTWQKNDEGIEGKPADDIYSQLLQVSGVKVVLFFKEKEGAVEVGMRSKNRSGIDIGAFAAAHGGGGHKYAAGATVPGSLEEVVEVFLKDLASLI